MSRRKVEQLKQVDARALLASIERSVKIAGAALSGGQREPA